MLRQFLEAVGHTKTFPLMGSILQHFEFTPGKGRAQDDQLFFSISKKFLIENFKSRECYFFGRLAYFSQSDLFLFFLPITCYNYDNDA